MAILPTNRQKKTEHKKHLIYNTALDLFKKYDFDTVTVDDICIHSGTSKGTFYYNFRSKEDLVVVAFIQAMDKYLEEHFLLDENCSFVEQFKSFVLCMFHFAESVGKDFTRRSYLAQISTQIELKIKDRVMVQNLLKLIERGKKENVFRLNYSNDEFYTCIIGTFTGLLVKWCTNTSDDFDWEKFVANQALLMLKGI